MVQCLQGGVTDGSVCRASGVGIVAHTGAHMRFLHRRQQDVSPLRVTQLRDTGDKKLNCTVRGFCIEHTHEYLTV